MATPCSTRRDVLADDFHVATNNSLLLGKVIELEHETLAAFWLEVCLLAFFLGTSLCGRALCLYSAYCITRTSNTVEKFPVLGRLHRRTHVKAALERPKLPRSLLSQSCLLVKHFHVDPGLAEHVINSLAMTSLGPLLRQSCFGWGRSDRHQPLITEYTLEI